MTKTLSAAAVLVALVMAGAPSAWANPQPTLGRAWAPSVKGYGTVRPARVFNCGDPTGDIWDITWSSWGGEQATGTGTSYWEPPGASVAESVKEPATIVAYKLGNCNGQSDVPSGEVVLSRQGRGVRSSRALQHLHRRLRQRQLVQILSARQV